MAVPLEFRKRILALAVETTYGTIESLGTAAAGYRFQDPDLKHVGDWIEREKNDGTLGTDVGAVGRVYSTLKMGNHMHGDGASGDPAWAAILFPTVGMPSHTSNGYRTSSTQSGWKGLSAFLNRDALKRQIRGAMGDLTITLESGMPIVNQWDYMGGFQAVRSDLALLSGITFEEVTPPIFAGASSFTLDASTTVATSISKAVIKLNNRPFARQDPNKTGGYIGGWINNPKPTVTIDPEAVAVSSKDWETLMRTADQLDMIFVAGTVSGNTVTITLTNCQQNKLPEDQERDGMLVDALNFNVNGTVTVVFS